MKLRIFLLLTLISICSCKSLKESWDNLNLFPITQDVELGKQVNDEISANQSQFPKVSEQGNEELYQYVRGIVNKILMKGPVEYSKDFAWQVTLINDIKTQNAFATPGGYIFVYTGLIKFLDSEDQLAGVLGHEIAHAAKRHSTKQLTKMVGLQVLADAALGNKETVKQVATALIGLTFSRAHETQADSMSVVYLCPTEYNAAGASGFFKKIKNVPTPPEWLSTHPNPSNRIENIDGKHKSMGCTGKETYKDRYEKIKLLLDKIPAPPGKPSTDKTLPNANTNKTKTADTKKDKMDKPVPTNAGKDTTQQHKKIEKPK
jgi:predicted Zn-dependent protease